jgi:hypothetical protein
VIGALVWLVVLTSLGLAGWAGWFAVRDRPVVLRQLGGAAVVEALLLVQAVAQLVLLARGGTSASVPLFVGYLIAGLLLLPLAGAWAFAERTRWSSVVLLVAAAVVAIVQWRLVQVWAG